MGLPIIDSLLENTAGKVIGKLVDKFLPPSMTEEEKAKFKLEAQKLIAEENKQIAVQIDSVNKTMQAEAKSDKFIVYGWRPVIGMTFAATIIFNYILNPIFGLPTIDIPAGIWNSMLVILGASAATRGWEKVEKIKKLL